MHHFFYVAKHDAEKNLLTNSLQFSQEFFMVI